VKKRLQEAHRPATKKNQDTAIIAFLMFLIFHELSVVDIHTFTVLAFIEFLAASKLSVSTIKNYISSIKSKLNILGIKATAFYSPRVAIVITSLEKSKVFVMKPEDFQAVFTQAERLPFKTFIRMAIILAYMAFLRMSNIAPKSLHDYDVLRDIRRGDITITHKGINVFIRWAKTLQKFRQTATIPLYVIPNSNLCPLTNFLILKNNYPVKPADPLLSYYQAGILRVVTQNQIRSAFHQLLNYSNLNKNITFHALRRSGASLAFASGVQFSSIQAHGTWTSDAAWSYIHHSARDTAIPVLFSRVFAS
jgi:integrase